MRRLIAYALVAGGVVLSFHGAREFLESRYGQNAASREFETLAATVQPAAAHQEIVHRGDTVAKLVIPRLDVQLYVIEGSGPKELRRGPGRMTGSAMPGDIGNVVITGHRDTHFRPLKDIRKGDDILLETSSGSFLYRVRGTAVASPKDTSSLRPTPNAQLHLVTCYPFYYVGSAPKRFVVRAELAGAASATAAHQSGG